MDMNGGPEVLIATGVIGDKPRITLDPSAVYGQRVRSGFGNGSRFRRLLTILQMILQPAIMSLPIVGIWYLMWDKGVHMSVLADGPVTNYVVPFIGAAHVFLAGFTFADELGEIRTLRRAVRRQDIEAMIEVLESRVPEPMKYALFVTGNIVNAWTMSMVYQEFWTGLAAVGTTSYVVALIWEVITDLDDPVSGVFQVHGIPLHVIRDFGLAPRLTDRVWGWLVDSLAPMPEPIIPEI